MNEKQEWVERARTAWNELADAEQRDFLARAAEEERKENEAFEACVLRFRAALQALGKPDAMTCDVERSGSRRPSVEIAPHLRLEARFAYGHVGRFQGLKLVASVGSREHEFPGTEGVYLVDSDEQYVAKFGRALEFAEEWVRTELAQLEAEARARAEREAEKAALAQAAEPHDAVRPTNPYHNLVRGEYAGQQAAAYLRDLTRYARTNLMLPTLPGQSAFESQREGLKRLAFYLYQLWERLDDVIAAQEAGSLADDAE